MKKLHGNQGGFTLIELIIATAIMGIIAFAITAFIGFGSRQYVYTNKQLKVQMEAQTVMNQISNMIMECNQVEVDPAATEASPSEYLCINVMEYNNPHRELATVADMHLASSRKITLDASKKRLYIQDMLTPGASGELLGEYVTDFKVTQSKITDDRYFVNVTLKFDYAGMNYTLTKKMEIRNRYRKP